MNTQTVSIEGGHFQHCQALVESTNIGRGAKIYAFTHVQSGAAIGCDAIVSDHVFVGSDVVIGDRATIMCGVQLWDGLRVEEDVYIGPNATFARGGFSPGRDTPKRQVVTRLCRGACIGANATVLLGLTIGQSAVVQPGAVVTHSVPAFAIVDGNPSRIIGYVDASISASVLPVSYPRGAIRQLRVSGAAIVNIPKVVDLRGSTFFAELDKELPFPVKRFFVVSDVPGLEARGEHAHKTLQEFLICLKGSFTVMLDDGHVREEVLMDSPNSGLHVPPQVWRVVYKYTPDAVMLSLCSHAYDATDYIRDYSEFIAFIGTK